MALTSDLSLCAGVQLNWPGNAYHSYPLQLHASDGLPYDVEFITPNGMIYVQSKKCHRMPRQRGTPCTECGSLNTSAEVEHVRNRATGSLPIQTNFRYYNFNQLCEVLDKKNDDRNGQKLKVGILPDFWFCSPLVDVLQLIRLQGKFHTATSRLSDHERFLNTLATDDRCAVGRLVAVALRGNRGISEITHCLQLSLRGLYHVKSYTVHV